MKKVLTLAALVLGGAAVLRAQTAPTASPRVAPTVDQILSLKRAGSPEISPDGRWVAYTVRETNWDDNAYETEIWLADVTTGATRQLTNAKKSSQSPAWSPDGCEARVHLRPHGQAADVRHQPAGRRSRSADQRRRRRQRFAWSPDGTTIAYTATEPKPAAIKERDKKYGEFEVVEQDHRMTHLFALDVATHATRTLTSGAFTVGSFSWSPDGKRIAFDHRVNPELKNGGSADISIVTVADAHRAQARRAGGTRLQSRVVAGRQPHCLPDGDGEPGVLLHATASSRRFRPLAARRRSLSSAFDEDPQLVDWKPNGLFFAASARTYAYLYKSIRRPRTIA